MHRRPRPFLPRALLACVPAFGLVMMASVGTAQAAHAPTNTRAALRTALEHALAKWHPTNRATGIGLKKLHSSNWSGYADTGSGFSSISGTWSVPKVTGCSATGKETVDVLWVGLDGISSSDPTVEQDGTGYACGSGIGPLTYFTWWELFPTNSIQVVGATVKAGDKISASVTRSGTSYAFKVTDSTTAGNNVSTSTTCASSTCKDASAEWIGERAAFESGGTVTLSPLADFHTWTLSNAKVKAGSKSGTIKSFADDEITMFSKTSGGHVLAQPGALNSKGNSFKDVWKAKS
jgi:Peptidase A4 family